jgi:hypothetical protein
MNLDVQTTSTNNQSPVIPGDILRVWNHLGFQQLSAAFFVAN